MPWARESRCSCGSLPHSESDLGTAPRTAPAAAELVDLQQALQRCEIRLHFQPVVSLQDGRAAGLEGHLTWQDPVRGIRPASGLVTVADAHGLAPALVRAQVEQACTLVHALNPDPLAAGPMFVALNVSARHLADPSITQDVLAVVRRTGINPALLVLELNELAGPAGRNATKEALRSLRAAGVRVSLDHFGGDDSSVLDLRELPVTEVKIDGDLVPSLEPTDGSLALVAGLVQLVHGLGLLCAADGVETAAQANALRGVGCDQAQGPYWGPAVPEAEAVARLLGR